MNCILKGSSKEISKISIVSYRVSWKAVLFKQLSFSLLQERLDCIHLVWQISCFIQIMGTASHLQHLKVHSSWTAIQLRVGRSEEVLPVRFFQLSKALNLNLSLQAPWEAYSGKAHLVTVAASDDNCSNDTIKWQQVRIRMLFEIWEKRRPSLSLYLIKWFSFHNGEQSRRMQILIACLPIIDLL